MANGVTTEQRPRAAHPLRQRATEALRTVAEACDWTIPSSWLRPGAPLSLLLFGMWLLPFMGAGIVRTVTGVTIETGFFAALPLEILLGLTFCARRRGPRPAATARAITIAGLLVGLALIGWSFRLLYSRDMGALVAYYGFDGGSHIGYRRLFVNTDPHTYFGFVSLYSVTHLLDRLLPLVPGTSFAIAFYSTLAVVAVAPLIVVVALLQGMAVPPRTRAAGVATFSITWLFALRSFVIPILGNMQADGFYGHLFGLLPVALIWLADVLFRPRLLRLLWMGAALVLCRFTYGLNLPDALCTCGALWLFDALGGRRRLIPVLAGAGAIAAAIVGWVALTASFRHGGYVEVYPFQDAASTMRIAVLTLAVYGVLAAHPGGAEKAAAPDDASMNLSTAIRWPVLFAFVALVSLQGFLRVPAVETYYVIKHSLVPLVFLAAAACICLAHAMALAATANRRAAVALAGLTMAVVIGHLAERTDRIFTDLREELDERNLPPPHAKLRPLVDRHTWNFIHSTLTTKHKTFGGYMSRDFPVAHFLNAWLGFDSQLQEFVAPAPKPGTCVFWDHPEDDPTFTYQPSLNVLNVTRSLLEAEPTKHCESYTADWWVKPRTLCYRCY